MRPSLLHVLALYLAIAYGAPISQRDSIGVSKTQLDQSELFAQCAGAAYCYSNVHDTGGSINCADEYGNCPLVVAASVSILKAFNERFQILFARSIADDISIRVRYSKTAGHVAVDDTNGLIVVAIQGTEISSSPTDVLTDIDIIPENTTLCGTANTNNECEFQSGFLWSDARCARYRQQHCCSRKSGQSNISNHRYWPQPWRSCGTLLGTYMRNQGNVIDKPHLATVDISNYIQNQAPGNGSNYQVTQYNNVVLQLPEHAMGDWDQHYPEFWIDIDDGTVIYTDIKIVTSTLYETSGNEGQRLGLTWIGDIIEGLPAHDQCFGLISNCSSTASGV